jgi:hypothetical protein
VRTRARTASDKSATPRFLSSTPTSVSFALRFSCRSHRRPHRLPRHRIPRISSRPRGRRSQSHKSHSAPLGRPRQRHTPVRPPAFRRHSALSIPQSSGRSHRNELGPCRAYARLRAHSEAADATHSRRSPHPRGHGGYASAVTAQRSSRCLSSTWLGTGPRGRGSADLFLAAGNRTRRPAAVPDMAIALSGPRGPRPGSAFPGLQCAALAGGRSRGARE